MLNQHPKKHRHAGTPNIVRDPLVDPGNPSHRYQARSTAHLDRPRSRMVALAASPPGPRSPRSPQAENATVMLGRKLEIQVVVLWRRNTCRRRVTTSRTGRSLLALQPFAEFRTSSPAGYIADRNGNRLLL